jgi:hypothetical protein
MADNVKKLILIDGLSKHLQYKDCRIKKSQLDDDCIIFIVNKDKLNRDIICDILTEIKDLK